MRVVQVIDSLAPGGAERSLVEMVPFLQAVGVQLDFLVLHDRSGLAAEAITAGSSVRTVAGNGRIRWTLGEARSMRATKPDLVHTTLFDADITGRVAARLAGIPCATTLVNTPYGPEHRGESQVSRLALRLAQLADLSTAPLAYRFRAVSTAVKDAYVHRVRIRQELVDVIPEGRDPIRLGTRSLQRRGNARKTLGLPDDAVVLLAVGRQEPQKAYDVLVHALPGIISAMPEVTLLIAGRQGRSTEGLTRAISGLRIQNHVRLLGHREDVAELMCAADVLVLPSRREGIPGVLQEAMALETPIVASDIDPVQEVLGRSEYGLLFRQGDPRDLSDAVIAVLTNPEDATERCARARRRFLDEFDIRVVAERMRAFFERAIGDK